MFSSEAWLANPSSGFYNGVATQSLRFDDGSSAYLSRTPSSTGNRRTYTISCWVKRSDLNTTAYIFKANTGTGDALAFRNHSTGTSPFTLYWFFADTAQGSIASTAVFRDVSSWYHVVLAVDTTQSTDTNRLKMYVNGTLLELGITNYPQQNYDSTVNTQVAHLIGAYASGNSHYDGYMSEFNFVDGLALDPTYFGETKNGVWIAKKPNVSEYGTNGFRLQFDQTGVGTASTSTIGADTSGKTNHFTSSGIVASDCAMPDSPENNFCTMNALDNGGNGGVTLTEGNLKTATASNDWDNVRSTFVMPTGSWYVELLSTSGIGNGNTFIGIIPQDEPIPSSFFGSASTSWGYSSNGNWYNNNGAGGNGATYSATDIVGMSFDGSTLKFYKNNSLQITIGSLPSREYSVAISLYDTDESCILNFGQDPTFTGIQDSSTAGKTPSNSADVNGNGLFFYAPPSGFLALCSANLPEPTISPNADTQAVNHFGTLTYTGDGNQTRTITSGATGITGEIDFQPDWIAHKIRSGTTQGTLNFDSSRGFAGAYGLDWSATTTEGTVVGANSAEYGYISGVGTNSFDVNDGTAVTNGGYVNYSGRTYVAWNWKANGGTTTTNDASATSIGDTDSVIQANTDAGFSIVTYTGFSGASGTATVAHGLSQAPEIIIHKSRTRTSAWWVQAPNVLSSPSHFLDFSTASTFELSSYGTMSAPTSSVFSINGVDGVGGESANYVAYCFHSVEGYSKIGGTYTGNSSSTGDGTFVYLGFKPSFVILKDIGGGEWGMFDSARNTFNVVNKLLNVQSAGVEYSGDTNRDIDFLSNGFKLRNGSALVFNNSARTYIYMAFAEAPFKYANAR